MMSKIKLGRKARLGYLRFIIVHLEYGSQMEVVLLPRGHVTTSKLLTLSHREMEKEALGIPTQKISILSTTELSSPEYHSVGKDDCPLRCSSVPVFRLNS